MSLSSSLESRSILESGLTNSSQKKTDTTYQNYSIQTYYGGNSNGKKNSNATDYQYTSRKLETEEENSINDETMPSVVSKNASSFRSKQASTVMSKNASTVMSKNASSVLSKIKYQQFNPNNQTGHPSVG